MCTVTVLPEALLSRQPGGGNDRLRLRVACNRDELVTRAPALPPITHQIGERRAIMPVDAGSGGTWIGVNDAGLVCALLNVCSSGPPPATSRSRGTIIPPLLGCDSLDTALERVRNLPADDYSPFRLLLVDGRILVECSNRSGAVHHHRQALVAPLMRTSSGLGDELVTGPRAALFERFLDVATDKIAAHDLFHLHQWRGREELSVRMRRKDARTVSYTVVEVYERHISLAYRPADAPDRISISLAA